MKKKTKTSVRALVFSGLGLNCEYETADAFRECGVYAEIVHLHSILEKPSLLRSYNIVAVPGGFSYGDDTGSGKAYGNRMKAVLGSELERFLNRDTLAIGICNGFQILTHTELLPGALVHNDSRTYSCRWVDVHASGSSPWLRGVDTLSIPIAHGEGKYVDSESNLDALHKRTDEALLTYVSGPMSTLYDLPYNPNGSLRDIAGLTSHRGRVLGLMPHPERGFFFTQRPDWTHVRNMKKENESLPRYADGYRIFENAALYFS